MTGVLPDRSASDLVLVVDDVPGNLSVLHDALDEAGYTVLIAANGEAAIERAVQAIPDIVLLDAVMPGMDGFELARQLNARPETSHIPIIFMTGLTETEHLVAAYRAGCVDYVTKPIRPQELLARMTVHMQSARQALQARNALDAFGHATMAIHADDLLTVGKAVWQTALARELMQRYFDAPVGQVPDEVLSWLRSQTSGEPRPLTIGAQARQLVLSLQQRTSDDDWLIVMREVSDAAAVQAL